MLEAANSVGVDGRALARGSGLVLVPHTTASGRKTMKKPLILTLFSSVLTLFSSLSCSAAQASNTAKEVHHGDLH